MSAADAPGAAAAETQREEMLGEMRLAFVELLGAERRRRGRDQHRREGLTMAQVSALRALERTDEATAGQLAEAADLNPASMTAMLDNLERDGIIARRRSQDDRRVCLVSLTEAGRALFAQRRALFVERWDERFETQSDAEIAAAVTALRAIAELLDTF